VAGLAVGVSAADAGRLVLLARPAGADTPALVRLGADLHRLRCALAAEGLASAWLPTDPADSVLRLAVGPPGT
jgi:coenzyme F420-0:L-glutamate ligase/coenzyme F420-1:gamma-L-glutamate ligase